MDQGHLLQLEKRAHRFQMLDASRDLMIQELSGDRSS